MYNIFFLLIYEISEGAHTMKTFKLRMIRLNVIIAYLALIWLWPIYFRLTFLEVINYLQVLFWIMCSLNILIFLFWIIVDLSFNEF